MSQEQLKPDGSKFKALLTERNHPEPELPPPLPVERPQPEKFVSDRVRDEWQGRLQHDEHYLALRELICNPDLDEAVRYLVEGLNSCAEMGLLPEGSTVKLSRTEYRYPSYERIAIADLDREEDVKNTLFYFDKPNPANKDSIGYSGTKVDDSGLTSWLLQIGDVRRDVSFWAGWRLTDFDDAMSDTRLMFMFRVSEILDYDLFREANTVDDLLVILADLLANNFEKLTQLMSDRKRALDTAKSEAAQRQLDEKVRPFEQFEQRYAAAILQYNAQALAAGKPIYKRPSSLDNHDTAFTAAKLQVEAIDANLEKTRMIISLLQQIASGTRVSNQEMGIIRQYAASLNTSVDSLVSQYKK